MKKLLVHISLFTILAALISLFGCREPPTTNTNVAPNASEQSKSPAASPTPSPQAEAPPVGPAIVISAADIAKEFAKDNFAADKKFGGKKIEVTGFVEMIEINKEPGTLSSVYMRGFKNHMVTCFAPQSETQRVDQLKKGEKVTFVGTESETSLNKQLADQIAKQVGPQAGGWNVEITDCIFK